MQSEDCGMRKLILMKSLHWEEPWRIPYNPTLPLCKFSLLLFLKEIHFPLPCYFSENLPYISVKYFIRLKATKFLLWIFNIKKKKLKKNQSSKSRAQFFTCSSCHKFCKWYCGSVIKMQASEAIKILIILYANTDCCWTSTFNLSLHDTSVLKYLSFIKVHQL